MCENCSKLVVKTSERCHLLRRSKCRLRFTTNESNKLHTFIHPDISKINSSSVIWKILGKDLVSSRLGKDRYRSVSTYYEFIKLLDLTPYVLTTMHLKVQSCKLCNSKYMIASTKVTNTEIFAFIAVLVFKLLSRKVLLINRKDNGNC